MRRVRTVGSHPGTLRGGPGVGRPRHVRSVAPFGVFVRLADGTDTLVELSHMTDDWSQPTEWTARSSADYASVGEVVQIRVLSIYEGRSQMRSELVETRSRS